MGEPLLSSLRQEFARWMRSDLGYAAAQTNVPADGAPNGRAKIVDVRGERWSPHTRRLQSAGSVLFGAAVVLENAESLRDAIFVSPNVLLAISLVLLVAAYTTKRRTRKYAWVSCRSERKPLRSGDVRKLREAVDAYGSRKATRWTPAEVILVSNAAGFDSDAVEVARALGIQCYRHGDAGFERVA